MSKHEARILELVNLRGTISVLSLAHELGVSDQTIRRVVRPLVDRGDLSKVHGALVSNKSTIDPPFQSRMIQNREAKIQIAKTVAEIIPDGASLAIDMGSTSAYVAQALRVRNDLTVVTNSAFVASTLAMLPGNTVSIAGTQLRNHDGASFDRSAFKVIEGTHVDFVVLSASMVDPRRGFMVFEQCEVDMATAMSERADRRIMAVDHSKFETPEHKPTLMQPILKEGDYVVTNFRPSEDFQYVLEKVTVKIAL